MRKEVNPEQHIPVLLNEVCEYAKGIPAHGGIFLDGTFGRGGHAREIMKLRPDFFYLAMDQDLTAIEHAKNNFAEEIAAGKFKIVHANFADFENHLDGQELSGALLDLGVSSPQLDQGQRGFSFYHDGPLDMRMDQSQGIQAKEIINTWTEDELFELFTKLGEVERPRKAIQKMIERREQKEFSTTGELANFIESVDGWRKKGHHPATNYFLALRLQVNEELKKVEMAMPLFAEALRNQGRLLVITFHSLEDRIVKTAFRSLEDEKRGIRVNKKTIEPGRDEVKKNPRSRSAKLRVWQKGWDEQYLSKNERKKSAAYLKRDI